MEEIRYTHTHTQTYFTITREYYIFTVRNTKNFKKERDRERTNPLLAEVITFLEKIVFVVNFEGHQIFCISVSRNVKRIYEKSLKISSPRLKLVSNTVEEGEIMS